MCVCICVCVCDTLKNEMTTHFSIFAWKIPWTEALSGLQFMSLQSHT